MGDFGSNVQAWLPLIIVLVLMWVLMIRPQQKKQKALNEMRKNMKKGDKVQSAGGLIGRVVKVKDDIITVECGSDKVRLEFLRNSLTVLDQASAPKRQPVVAEEEEPQEAYEEEYDEYSDEGSDEEYEEYDFSEGASENEVVEEYVDEDAEYIEDADNEYVDSVDEYYEDEDEQK